MTPGQYRLHRLSTMRAAMRASALFSPLACGADECWVHRRQLRAVDVPTETAGA